MTRNYFLLLFLLVFAACLPPQEEKLTEVSILLEDPVYQELYNFQDQGLTDSLIRFFRHENPTYRFAAAMALGSVQDPSAIDSLAVLLNDDVEKVATAAAYAIGQIGEESAEGLLIAAFDSTLNYRKNYNRAVLEAVGKCASEPYLEALSTVSTYTPQDTALIEGQAWGIYRFALRGITSPTGTKRMFELATDQSIHNEARLIASNYLYRAQDIKLDGFDSQLAQALAREDDPRIRMALAIALGKTETTTAQDALISQFNIESDYRVKCNILRAMGNFPYEQVKPTILRALEDDNIHVSKCAATYFLNNGQPQEAKFYWEKAKDTLNWETQLELYAAANRHMPAYFNLSKNQINDELKQRFENSNNIYERATAIKALGEFGWNYRYIITKTFPSTEEVIRTSCIEALQKIVYMEDFRTFFSASYRRVRQEISNHMVEVLKTGDAGMIAVASNILRHPTLFFEGTLDSLTLLEDALQGLPLPRAIETYNELQKTLDFFNEKDSKPRKPNYNHPINWELAAQINPNTIADISTSKGNIKLRLLPEYAPGTVTNFIQLAQDKYFDGKVFHRVVPNFVIQGGCPRGDGYGSLDYTIRSELPYLHYDKGGYVGMASSGKDTEGTQFFITHSPTLHLDGKYTIFAEVEEGMNVVHNIGSGDKIQSITIQESN